MKKSNYRNIPELLAGFKNTDSNQSISHINIRKSDLKECENCKFFIKEKIRCTHGYWQTCIVMDDKEYVVEYRHHRFR